MSMRGLILLLLAQISVQFQCDKTKIQATIGSTFAIVCTYKTSQYRFNKKYWCAGDSRASCEVVMDTDGFTQAQYRPRAQIIDGVSKGVIVQIRDLKLEDTGTYWIAIDKIYADLMTRIQVTVTKEAVMKPNVWPLSSLENTCRGQPAVFRCRSERGTDVKYTWYKVDHPNNIVLCHSADLYLHCSNITEDGHLFCSAFNDVSSQSSEFVSLQILQPADQNCVYLISSAGLSSYDCIRSTTTVSTTITELQKSTEKPQSSATFSQLTWSQNTTIAMSWFWSWHWSGLQLWYECLRWLLFSTIIAILCTVHVCSKPSGNLRARGKHPKEI